MSVDQEASYAAVYAGHLEAGNHPALLVVDVVMAYLEPSSPLYAGVEDALASNERLVAATRSAGHPVIFTCVEYLPGGADGGLFYRKVPALSGFDHGSPLGEFPPTLQPDAKELVIVKQFPSAFFGTSLDRHLKTDGIDTLIITGFSTSGCVRATALDALQHGYVPIVVRDACGDRHPASHEASLFDLQAKYAEVVSGAHALKIIGRDFRPVT